MGRKYTALQLRQENLAYSGTGGVSENCRSKQFQAAFQDTGTGRIELARFDNGQPAPMHIFSGLPDDWIVQRDSDGHPLALLDTIQAGFVRAGDFYTREQAAALV
jgi:hypothetical protein